MANNPAARAPSALFFVAAVLCAGSIFRVARVAHDAHLGETVVFASTVVPVIGALVWAVRRARTPSLPASLLTAAAGTLAGPASLSLLFDSFVWRPALSASLAVASAALGTSLAAAIRNTRTAAPGPAPEPRRLPRPLWFAAVFITSLALLGVTDNLGLVRAAVVSAAALAVAALTLPRVEGARASHQFAVLGGAVPVLAAAAMLISHARSAMPLAEIAAYPNPIVYATTANRRYVVTAGSLGLELYEDHQLSVSELDAHRYFAALLAPAKQSPRPRRRVLLVEGGTGLAEAEILSVTGVAELVVVASDPELLRLSRRLSFVASRSRDALSDPRVRVVFDEATAWVDGASDRFDLIVADLAAPATYLEGKYYTTWFFSRLSALLAHDGLLVTGAPAGPGARDTASAVRATLVAAGFSPALRPVALPTLGTWGIFACIRAEEGAPAGGVPLAADEALDETAPATLQDQRVVHSFRRGRVGPEPDPE